MNTKRVSIPINPVYIVRLRLLVNLDNIIHNAYDVH